MDPNRRGGFGAAFLVLAVLATTLLMAAVTLADSTAVRDSQYFSEVHDGTVVRVNLQLASPGDVVVVRYTHSIKEPIMRYDFLVTEREDAHRIAEGESPEQVHFRRENLTAGDCCDGVARIVRPAGEGDRLALVWIYHLDASVPAPEGPEEEEALIHLVRDATSDTDTAETVPRAAVVAHGWLLASIAITGVSAAVAGILWVAAGSRSVSAPAARQETEALVSLVYAGRDHLRTLRGILGAALAFLVLTGTVVLSLFFIYLQDFIPAPVDSWHRIVQVSFFGIWGMLAAAAIAALVRVQHALRRWESALREDPLG